MYIYIYVCWIPSRLAGKLSKDPHYKSPDFVPLFDIKANDRADEIAGKAATSAGVPLNVSSPYIYVYIYYYYRTRHIYKNDT